MAKHTWTTGEVITADLMNALETTVDTANTTAVTAKSTADEAKTAAMKGTAVQLTKIATPESAQASEIATKVNEIIDQLIARGVSNA